MNFLERSFDNQNQWWKYIVLIIIFIVASIIGSLPLLYYSVINNALLENGDINYNLLNLHFTFFLELFIFVIILISLILMWKWLHKRTLVNIINGTKKIRWNKIFFSFSLFFAISIVFFIPDLINFFTNNTDSITFSFNFNDFFILICISFLLIPIQAGVEELFFRGYLAQGISRATNSRWFVLLIPAVLFGLLHSFNPEVEKFGLLIMIPQYIFIGLFLGIISILDDGLESSIGIHSANNIFLSLIITFESSVLQTHALFTFPEENINPINDFLIMIIMSIVVFYILFKKYKWNLSVINKKIK